MGKIIKLITIMPSASQLKYTADTSKSDSKRTALKVTLGIMPDYIYDSEGIKIDGVKDGKPAAAAGLQKGDIIIGLAGEKIPNMQAYMKVLAKIEKGQKAEIIYIRNGVTLTTEVQF